MLCRAMNGLDTMSTWLTPRPQRHVSLLDLSDDEFVRTWTRIVGEPPACLLPRRVMIDILLSTWPSPGFPEPPCGVRAC